MSHIQTNLDNIAFIARTHLVTAEARLKVLEDWNRGIQSYYIGDGYSTEDSLQRVYAANERVVYEMNTLREEIVNLKKHLDKVLWAASFNRFLENCPVT